MSSGPNPEKLAILVGGGPAPGINGVISSVAIEAVEQGTPVVGFYDGFKWLVQGLADRPEYHRPLTIDAVRDIQLRGGSMLRTSRTNPTKPPAANMQSVLDTLRRMNVTKLVTIGGDDTAYSGSQVYAHASGAIRVAHVPKTIDNDLPLPGSIPTFGFETARHVGAAILRNLSEDARTTSRWFLVVSMGRAAGHLALGIGKSAAATLTIIPEEFREQELKLDDVCDILIGAIVKRRSKGRPHGVAVLAEGLLEAIGEKGLKASLDEGHLGRYGKIEYDDFGHLRLGNIDFGRMIRDRLADKLREMNLDVSLMDKELGYELRCADPIPFDVEYTRDLGYGAAQFLRSPESCKYGAVISLQGGKMKPLPFEELLDPQTKRMRPRRVNIDGEGYACARHYMIRLEPRDFSDDDRLARLAAAAGLTPERFRERFDRAIVHG
jgi:6-phosphofructokinase 1